MYRLLLFYSFLLFSHLRKAESASDKHFVSVISKMWPERARYSLLKFTYWIKFICLSNPFPFHL